MSRRFPGLRVAAIVYALVVALGLGAAGAHALWSQSGAVTMPVTAGTWGPTQTVTSVICTGRTDGDKLSDITVNWTNTDATSYLLSATAPNGGSAPAAVEPKSGPATLRFGWPNGSGRASYVLTITPKAAGVSGTPTTIDVVLDHRNTKSVDCTVR